MAASETDRAAEAPASPRLVVPVVEPGGETKSCPSAPCIEGALLLGVVTESGRGSYVQPPTRVDADFVARAEATGRPENRFRFSAPCIEAGCSQWTGSGCAVADRVVALESTDEVATRLPPCAIRRTCRWFHQRGAQACGVCPVVVADCGGTATHRSTQPPS
jgi:hypothetical protein